MRNKKIVFIISLLCLSAVSVTAQNSLAHLYGLFEQQRFDELQTKLKQTAKTADNKYELQFFETLFLRDGEKAGRQYEAVYKKATGKAKYYAAKKLMDFYYAKGFYVHAAEFEKYMVEHQIRQEKPLQPGMPAADETGAYFIQVGAFSLKDNAMQLVGFLAVQNIQSGIVQKIRDGKILYCVWIPGKVNLDETLHMANEIKQKYALEYQIKKK